jgi:hypothetical protein
MIVAVWLQPTVATAVMKCVAERRLNPASWFSIVASATQLFFNCSNRGLKHTATIVWSLRDQNPRSKRCE